MNLANLPPYGSPEYWRAIRQIMMRAKVDIDRLWGATEPGLQIGMPSPGGQFFPVPNVALASDAGQTEAWGSCSCYELALSRSSFAVWLAGWGFIGAADQTVTANYVNTSSSGGILSRNYTWQATSGSSPYSVALSVKSNCTIQCNVTYNSGLSSSTRQLDGVKCRGTDHLLPRVSGATLPTTVSINL